MVDRGSAGQDRGDSGVAGVWSATLSSLERIGLGGVSVIPDDGGTWAARLECLGWLRDSFEAAAAGNASGMDGSQAGGLAEGAPCAGDAVVLIVADVANLQAAEVWARARGRLREKNFLRSWTRVERGDLGGAVGRVFAGTGFQVRVQPSVGLLDALGAAGGDEAAVVRCAWSAHLALVHFVERRFGLRAECVGRVVAAGITGAGLG